MSWNESLQEIQTARFQIAYFPMLLIFVPSNQQQEENEDTKSGQLMC